MTRYERALSALLVIVAISLATVATTLGNIYRAETNQPVQVVVYAPNPHKLAECQEDEYVDINGTCVHVDQIEGGRP